MINIIVAFDENNLIGARNKLPWSIKEDLNNFKLITTNNIVVMGRKTFESIGKALPNRENVVLSRKIDYNASGVVILNNLNDVFSKFDGQSREIFIIGGGEIYKEALEISDRLYISHIKGKYKGDIYFPEINYNDWNIIREEEYEKFVFKIYQRR